MKKSIKKGEIIMFKVEMNAKDFKEVVEKGLTAIAKKTQIPWLTSLLLEVKNGILSVYGTNMEQYLEVRAGSIWAEQEGKVCIEKSDLKLLMKMKGVITLIEQEGNRIEVKNGKKVLTMPSLDTKDFPTFPEPELKSVAVLEENNFLDAVENLKLFLPGSSNDKVLSCYNLNWEKNIIYALDGHRIGWKQLEANVYNNEIADYLVVKESLSLFKKVLDKKSDAYIHFYDAKEYISIVGENFTYTQKKIEGRYFNVDNLLHKRSDVTFTVNREEMLDIMKYNVELAKENTQRFPVLFMAVDKVLYIYFKNVRMESVDRILAENLNMTEENTTGFIPTYWKDILTVADSNKIKIYGGTPTSPWIIEADKYGFFILPFPIEKDILEDAKKKITQMKTT